MKTLRFRVNDKPIIINCGSKNIRDTITSFPVVFQWNTGNGEADVHLINQSDKPIKLKIFIDGILTQESQYIGDPVYQSDLDNFNSSNFLPQENITNVSEITLVATGTSLSSIATIKVYCPLAESAFELDLNCN